MNNLEIQEKIKRLREYYYDDEMSLKVVDGIEQRLRQAITADKLAENKSVIGIVEEAERRVSMIDTLLITDEKMTQEVRAKLLTEKKVHRFYLERFDNKKKDEKYKSINEMLDQEIRRL